MASYSLENGRQRGVLTRTDRGAYIVLFEFKRARRSLAELDVDNAMRDKAPADVLFFIPPPVSCSSGRWKEEEALTSEPLLPADARRSIFLLLRELDFRSAPSSLQACINYQNWCPYTWAKGT